MSCDFAAKLTGKANPAAAAQALWTPGRAAVVVTAGPAGAWWLGPDDPAPWHQPAFRVEVVDTTGCGDVFHGAYAAALAEGLPLSQRVRRASAAAALKATRAGGQAGAPDRVALEAFLAAAPC